jgi:hypothetical protein
MLMENNAGPAPFLPGSDENEPDQAHLMEALDL